MSDAPEFMDMYTVLHFWSLLGWIIVALQGIFIIVVICSLKVIFSSQYVIDTNGDNNCSYFIKLLLEKKYDFPYCVVDAVVAHFMRFVNETRIMPVIWHQSLLTFVQRPVSSFSVIFCYRSNTVLIYFMRFVSCG
jgi:hypothetical protein